MHCELHNEKELNAENCFVIMPKNNVSSVFFCVQVVEAQMESGAMQYKVHYAGWNIRYDEWVRRDRIVSMVDRGRGVITTPTGPQPNTPPLIKVTKAAGWHNCQVSVVYDQGKACCRLAQLSGQCSI